MQSMTGCGKGTAVSGAWTVTVELRSVNHRFLDLALRLPRELAFAEAEIRKALTGSLKRGHVDVYCTVVRSGGSTTVAVDEALAKAYAEAAERLAALVGNGEKLGLAELMQMEGVLTVTQA